MWPRPAPLWTAISSFRDWTLPRPSVPTVILGCVLTATGTHLFLRHPLSDCRGYTSAHLKGVATQTLHVWPLNPSSRDRLTPSSCLTSYGQPTWF
jgi:hypothetical protein